MLRLDGDMSRGARPTTPLYVCKCITGGAVRQPIFCKIGVPASHKVLQGHVALLPLFDHGAVAALLKCKQGRAGDAPLLGLIAAFIFAAQMLNFPIAAGTSGHFLGAALAVTLLGPAGTMIVFTIVLTAQCLLFSDGGLTALGTNIVNMGLVGGGISWLVFSFLRAALPKNRAAFLASAGVAAWASVVSAASACALELAVSNTVPLWVALPAMAGIHALIGVGEAIVTIAALSVVLAARPDLVRAWKQGVPA